MGQVRKHILLPLCHLILRKVLQAIKIGVKCRGWGDCFVFVCLVLLWIFFFCKTKEVGGQRHYSLYVLEIKKAHSAWLVSFLSVRILLYTHDTALPVQLKGSKD